MLGIHVKNLASVLTRVDSGQLQDQLDERLRAFADGEIDHASEAFSSLWKTLTTDGGGGGVGGKFGGNGGDQRAKFRRRKKVRFSSFSLGCNRT